MTSSEARASETETVDDRGAASSSPPSSSSLPLPHLALFALNGATLQLPLLALLSIVNDVASVPPAYLPAYGAVAFLPWSCKPIYAAASAALVGSRSTSSSSDVGAGANSNAASRSVAVVGGPKPAMMSRHALLATLLVLSGLSYAGTALLIPPGGVASCFVWGFVRGVTASWPEFLLGVTLIETAKRRAAAADATARPDGGERDGRDDGAAAAPPPPRYEELASVYQSGAATSRNVGSLGAATLTFVLFAWRHHHRRGDDDDEEEELSDGVVVALLLTTAALCVAGGMIAFGYEVGTPRDDGEHGESSAALLLASPSGDDQEQEQEQRWEQDQQDEALSASVGRKRRARVSGLHLVGRVVQYDEIATRDENDYDTAEGRAHLEIDAASARRLPRGGDASFSSMPDGNFAFAAAEPPIASSSSSELESRNLSAKLARQQRRRRRCDVASLALFQSLLVLAALRRPIVSAATNAIWLGLVVVVGLGLLVTIVASSCYQRKNKEEEDSTYGMAGHDRACGSSLGSTKAAAAVPPRRLGLYLILRHSVPIPSYLMYSYVYTIFASDPTYLQFLSIVESGVSTVATWFYGRYVAERYNSGWSMIGLIAVLSVVSALVSLLDVVVVRSAAAAAETSASGEGDGADPNLDADADSGGGSGDHVIVDAHLRWLVFFVSIFTYFMGELGFMPSMVLATTNVVSADEFGGEGEQERDVNSNDNSNDNIGPAPSTDQRHADFGGMGGISPSSSWSRDSCSISGSNHNIASSFSHQRHRTAPRHEECQQQPPPSPVYDESMQYATFVSCIDFGAQVGDWISVPIISALSITRENGWANLDRYIVICALARIGSVAFLWLLRPPPSPNPRALDVPTRTCMTTACGSKGVLS